MPKVCKLASHNSLKTRIYDLFYMEFMLLDLLSICVSL